MKKRLLTLHLSRAKVDPQLNDVIKGWLAEELENPSSAPILEEIFNKEVSYGKPRASTYRQLEKLRKRLNFPDTRKFRIPLTERVSFRVAAVLVPVVLFLGLFVSILRNPVIVQPEEERQLIAVTVPQSITAIEVPQVVEDNIKAEQIVQEIVVRQKPKERISYDISISVPHGESRRMRLPDNSYVMINGGTQLDFSTARREARVNGEAFFDVAKGQSQPFHVATDYLGIHVSGTKFNVKARSDSATTVVDLLEGSVDVHTGTNKVCLLPMEQLMLSNNSGVVKTGKASRDGWWNEIIAFNDRTLSSILHALETYYSITIQGKELITDPGLYTVTFERSSSIEYTLGILKQISSEFCYSCEENRVSVYTQNI